MSFLERFYQEESKTNIPEWNVLDELSQLQSIRESSFRQPVVLFKHSVRCGISAMAKHHLESNWPLLSGYLEFYFLDLIRYRSVSDRVAEEFGVRHQSPQVIILRDGQVVFHTSHHKIQAQTLRLALSDEN